jgi:hypothetical protein
MNERVTREQMVMQSVVTYVRAALFDTRGYPEDQIDLLDAFPHEQIQAGQPIEKTAIAVGFNFDDHGTPLELGSSLKRRIYTIELFVFGVTPVWSENLANAVKFAVDVDETIPLLDVSDPDAPPIDTIDVADDYFAALA